MNRGRDPDPIPAGAEPNRDRPAPARLIGSAVDARLVSLLDAELARWRAVDADLAEPLEALRAYTMAGGKRLRPAFCYWAFVGAGGNAGDAAMVEAGAALEMLHTAALVHDDIIDRSARRHGAETVHVRLGRLHRQRGLSGDPDRFGEGTAILVGDLALVYSSRLMAGAGPEATAVFEEMRLEVNVGQYLDVLGGAEGPARGAARAGRICRYKTAKYTVERPLHIGAALAVGAGWRALAGPLSDFALPLGEAFQLKDDLLGAFGDPAVTGKPVGDDLREGKPTLLAGLTAARDPRFAAIMAGPERGEREVAQMLEMIEATGARSEVQRRVETLLEDCDRALGRLPLRAEARDALGQLARFVGGRDR